MKKRVFICGFYNFPRGSASSNYVQYLSVALVQAGYEVHLISDVNHAEGEYENRLLERLGHDLILHEIVRPKNKIARYLQFHYFLGREIVKQLKACALNEEDIVLTYTNRKLIQQAVYACAKKRRAKVGAIIVEWYSREEFYRQKEYVAYRDYFEKGLSKFDFLIPISSYIQEQFEGKGVKTFILPVIEDPDEYERKEKSFDGRIKIVYPANGMMKDALSDMLKAIALLSDDARERVEFHFCGVKESKVIKTVGEEEYRRIGECITLHGWMSYDELIALYRACHFLLLAREVKQLTKANFPGKVPEVMMHGVVPIVSVVGDYTKLYLKDGVNSLQMEGCDAQVIGEALERALRLTREEYQSLSDRAYETVCTELSCKVWAERLKDFFEKV